MTHHQDYKSIVICIWYTLYHLWDLAKFYIFTLSFCINKHLMVFGLGETCSVWENNNKYRLCRNTQCYLCIAKKTDALCPQRLIYKSSEFEARPVCQVGHQVNCRSCARSAHAPESHDLEHYSLLSYVSAAFEISTTSASWMIGIVKRMNTPLCIHCPCPYRDTRA